MIAYFVRHPVASNLLLVLMCVLGVSILTSLERETFPEFAADSVSVSVVYPGASARDVDDEICAPIEDGLTGIGGMTELKCVSTEGRAVATAELEEGGEIITFFNEVFSAVSGINDFPDDAETPIVEIDGTEDLVALLAVSGILNEPGLLEYADTLSDEILLLDGVADAKVSGLTDRELQVEFDPDALRRYGVSSREVVDAITARSLRQPLGSAALSEGDMILRYSGAQRTVADMEDLIVIENADGALVRVSDLGRVTFADGDENVESFINGQQAVIITVFKSKDADTIRVFDAVQEVLEAERAKYPDPFELTVINNMSEVVEERLALIFSNIAVGLVLVFATMWLFFSFKEALWISVALPASFLGGLFVMSLLGITINTITTVALLMAVGLIMDDGIVIAENIDKWRKKVGPLEAAAKGAAEVLPGVISSFITTACIFGPLMLLSGEIGQILRFIPMVLLITLALSVVEGFLILPNHLSHVARKDDTKREPVAVRALYWVRDRLVVPAAAALVKVRYFTLGASIAAFIMAIGIVASGAVKVIGFPATEGDTIIARVALTSGINRERTVETVEQLLSGLDQVNTDLTPGTEGGQPLVERVLIQYATNTDAIDNGSHTATVTVDLLESALRKVDADEVLDAWRAATGPMPDISQVSFSQAEAGPGGLDIDVEILGRDLGEVEGAANMLVTELLRRADVTEAFQNFAGGRSELQIALKPFGYTVGLTPQTLAGQIRQAFEGSETDSFRSGASAFSVRVALSDSVSSLADLEDFPITLNSGEQTTLSRVADLSLAETYPAITRKNGKAVAQVQGKIDLTAITSTEISAVITGEIAPQITQAFPNVDIQIGGATQEQQESQSSVMSLFLVGLIGVYLVLAFQFRSYSLPIVVMVAIPFALIGTTTGHWLLGLDMSMPSIVGFASLAGIVVNNAILFLTFFKSHLQGDDYLSASISAVRERFRPIVLSTFTTVAGLAPIILDGSPQVQTLVPLVVAVAFGLLAAMVLVLLVLPSLVSIYFDMFNVRSRLRKFDVREQGGSLAIA